MSDILNMNPFDIPHQEAINNISAVRRVQERYENSNPSVSIAEGIELYPNDPLQVTKDNVDIIDIVYNKARLPDDNEVVSANNRMLRYGEITTTYIGSDEKYYVATTGRVYVPTSRKRYKGDWEELDGTLWAPGTGTLPPGHNQALNEVLGTWVVDSSSFFNIRLATDEEIAAAKAAQQYALSVTSFVLGDDGLWRLKDECFLSHTPIAMWPLDPSIKPATDGQYDETFVRSQVWTKPIEDISPNDIVLSHDKDGNLKPGHVTRLFRNEATHILDFWGTGVTPGHAYLCGDGPFQGQYVPIMDILRTDGAIMRDDGRLIRAATGCEVGSVGDRMVQTIMGDTQPDGLTKVTEAGQIRFGSRFILENGQDVSVMDLVAANGGRLTEDGLLQTDDSTERMPFRWTFTAQLPKPEDYILQRSDVTLAEIYAADEWESIGTNLSAPVEGFGLPAAQSRPQPNVPRAFQDHPDAPVREHQKRQTAVLRH